MSPCTLVMLGLTWNTLHTRPAIYRELRSQGAPGLASVHCSRYSGNFSLT